MPLVRIDVPDALSRERVQALADAVHAALVETVDVPVADRFQVINRHGAADLAIDPTFLGVARSPEAVVVSVTFRKGRSDEKKRNFYKVLAAEAQARAKLRPEDVMIVLTENTLIDWSFGEGVAHYAPDPEPRAA